MSFKAVILVTAKTNWGLDVMYSVSYVTMYQGKYEKKILSSLRKVSKIKPKDTESCPANQYLSCSQRWQFLFSVNINFKRNNLAIFSKSVHLVLVYVKIPVPQERCRTRWCK
jgi:hypothetical protein